MRKIYLVLLCISLFAGYSAVSGQQQQTTNTSSRPRINPTPTPTPAPETTTTTTTKRPPILIGDTSKTNQQPQTKPAPTATPAQKDDDDLLAEDEVIRVETNLVTMPVSVLDRDGRFISGLRQQDFQIFEDNVAQRIESFGTVEQPFTVVLLIDVSPSTQYQITEIQDAAITFVNQLRPEDRVIVMSFDEKVRTLSPATNNRALLRNAILETDFGNGTSLYEAIDVTLNRQLRQIQGRKAVVIFTDGVDTTSRRASYESTIREAEESEALIYPIRYDTYSDMSPGWGGGSGGGGNGGGYPNQYPYPRRRRSGGGGTLGAILGGILSGGGVTVGGSNYPQGGGSAGGSREDYARGARYLEELARNSGGRIFQADTTRNLDAAFSGIAEELRRQYTIGYYPEPVGQPGQRKQIRIRVNRTGAVVRAKNSYIVAGNGNGNGNSTTQNRQTPQQQQQPQPVRKPPQILNRLPF